MTRPRMLALTLAIAAAWSALSVPARAQTMRISDLDLRDPHFYLNANPLCPDITDTQFLGFAVNNELQKLITMDGDGDNFLDLSFLIIFDTLDPSGPGGTLTLEEAICTFPMAGTVCQPDPLSVPVAVAYQNLTVGTCLSPLPGTLYDPYTPEVTTPSSPCFVTDETVFDIDLGGIVISLTKVRVAGTYVGNPPTAITDGMMRGFMSETVADATLIPASFPVVGGQPLSVLLPGGTNNCATHTDMDTDGIEPGWWFYFNYIADAAAYTAPVQATSWGAVKAIYR